MYVVCLKRSVNGTRKKQNRRYKQINFIGLQNNRHPSQTPAGACGLLFPRLKSIMKGARFADVAAIQKRVTAVLRSIPKEAFC
jgi:hypothetical protein